MSIKGPPNNITMDYSEKELRMTNRIAIIKDGHEGGIHIEALTGQVIQEGELPAWAEGYVVAALKERTGWYEQRLGANLPPHIYQPEVMKADDLEWLGLDAEGEEVHIEASLETRFENLATYMGLDTSVEGYMDSPVLKNAVATAEIAHTYTTHPTEEATLAEVEGHTFGAVEKKAING